MEQKKRKKKKEKRNVSRIRKKNETKLTWMRFYFSKKSKGFAFAKFP
jgi:hypothetical protein